MKKFIEPRGPEYARSYAHRKHKKSREISTVDLAALSFAAYRLNGQTLHKFTTHFDEQAQQHVAVIPNKTMMLGEQDWPMHLVTDQDRELAQTAKDAILSASTFRILKGQKISDFVQAMTDMLNQDTCSERDCGLMSYLPQMYHSQQQQDKKESGYAELSVTSQWLGKPGDNVKVDFQLIDKRFLLQYNCWAVTGHDGQGNVVSFLSKHEDLAVSGPIQGRVKRLEQSSYHCGAQVTSLNYVKKQ